MNPSSIMLQRGITATTQMRVSFVGPLSYCLSTPKGAPVVVTSGGANCGSAGHFINALNYAAFVLQPDWKYCNYVLVWGTSAGVRRFHAVCELPCVGCPASAGMKVGVFDPVCNYAASKATEWVPLTPGTDGAVALAMLNVIVNELGSKWWQLFWYVYCKLYEYSL